MTSSARADAMIVTDPLRTVAPPDDLAARTLFGFSLGMIGDRIFRRRTGFAADDLYDEFPGVPPAMAGLAIFVPKLLIMAVDPIVGTISDRLDTRWGRRRPLMLVGALLASAAIVLFFHVPALRDARGAGCVYERHDLRRLHRLFALLGALSGDGVR